jgi:hypothetical protein
MAGNESEREGPRMFEWRRQQFLRSRHPPDGLTPTQARTLAIQGSLRLGELSQATLDLAETPPKRDLDLEVPEGSSGSVNAGRRPRFTPAGFVGRVASVRLKPRAGDDAILKVRLGEKDQARVVVETVRMFRVDGNDWRIVPRCGAALDGTHIWCLLASGGVFAAAGIVRHPSVVAVLLASYDLRSFLYPLFRERQTFSQAIGSLTKTKNWRALAKRSGPIVDETDTVELKRALDRLRRNAPTLAKIKSAKNGPVEWQILDVLAMTPDGQRVLAELDAVVEREQS